MEDGCHTKLPEFQTEKSMFELRLAFFSVEGKKFETYTCMLNVVAGGKVVVLQLGVWAWG
jgi:hypothetical protein